MCTYDEHLEAELLPLGSTVQINKNSSLEKEQNAWNRGKRRRSCVLTYRCSKKKKRVRINGGNVSAREPTTKCTQKKKRRKDGNGRSRVKVWDSIFFFFTALMRMHFWVVGFPLSSQHVLKATFIKVDWALLPTDCTFFSLQERSCDVRLIAKPQPMRSKKSDYTDTHEKRTRCFSFSCTRSFPSFYSDNEGLTMARLHREGKKAVATAHVCLVSLCHTIHFDKQNKRATK